VSASQATCLTMNGSVGSPDSPIGKSVPTCRLPTESVRRHMSGALPLFFPRHSSAPVGQKSRSGSKMPRSGSPRVTSGLRVIRGESKGEGQRISFGREMEDLFLQWGKSSESNRFFQTSMQNGTAGLLQQVGKSLPGSSAAPRISGHLRPAGRQYSSIHGRRDASEQLRPCSR
jgi:hypothetical protein